MVFMILSFFGGIAVSFIFNKIKIKKLGKPVILASVSMERNEVISLCIRSFLAIAVALILQYEKYIKNEYALVILLCVIMLYSANIIFPIFYYAVYKNKVGVYENGVFAYGGVMEYSKMKEYIINEHKNRKCGKQTVYCKSTVPLFMAIQHFDINDEAAKEIHTYFRRKHKQMSGIRNKKQRKKNA